MASQWSGDVGITDQFLEMMPDTIIFNASTAMDKYGKKTFGGSNVSVRGRVQYETDLIKDDYGQDIVAMGKVYLYGNYSTITLTHKMTLPNGTSPVIVKVDNKSDTGATAHHTVVYFGQ